jgi:adenosylcobalamin-dependent ribonucleoside-triphosphate reductase
MRALPPAREYFAGMGQAVADRTINRKKPDGTIESWEDVSKRVALGNSLLEPRPLFQPSERRRLEHHLRQASVLMSGRHLQHGDETQPGRNMEVFCNCSTAATTFLMFYLLLNGSGVGRCYDDAMMQSDLNYMPIVICTIDWTHKDVANGLIQGYMTRRDAEHLYADRQQTVFEVPDTREGWAKAIELVERMAFENRRDDALILDFSKVRPRGEPIMGMQGRPASGPGPLMAAICNIARLRDAGMEPWRAAMYADHYAAECVLVGGARRAARMATKTWRDFNVLSFIGVKRGGFLWSSNNSVTIDEEFRESVKYVRLYEQERMKPGITPLRMPTPLELHAYKVASAIANAAYYDRTGEPGLINVDRLVQNDSGMDSYTDGLFANSAKLKLDLETIPLMQSLATAAKQARYKVITNPCGEIVLFSLGGYCVIADVVPFHAAAELRAAGPLTPVGRAQWDSDAEDAFRTATRALIRVNLMDCLYKREVNRTNRIGVGITGFHEWVYARFGFTWKDIIDEKKSRELWLTMARFKRAISAEAERYSKELGVVTPHTNTTFKPAGTTSKLFGLTEGAHLPSMREFVRWVQFRNDDPLVEVYRAKGYPVKVLQVYKGHTVIGFPTRPAICQLDGGEWVVTAAEATPEDQYQFLRLLEKYWLRGIDEDGNPLAEDTGNQVSYTLKYDPEKVSFDRFFDLLIDGQFSVKACSVMPQIDTTAFEYQPESPVSKLEFEKIATAIQASEIKEDVGLEHVDCASGACPVSFNQNSAAAA